MSLRLSPKDLDGPRPVTAETIEVIGAAFKKDRTAPRNTSWFPGRDGAGADVQCLEL